MYLHFTHRFRNFVFNTVILDTVGKHLSHIGGKFSRRPVNVAFKLHLFKHTNFIEKKLANLLMIICTYSNSSQIHRMLDDVIIIRNALFIHRLQKGPRVLLKIESCWTKLLHKTSCYVSYRMPLRTQFFNNTKAIFEFLIKLVLCRLDFRCICLAQAY